MIGFWFCFGATKEDYLEEGWLPGGFDPGRCLWDGGSL